MNQCTSPLQHPCSAWSPSSQRVRKYFASWYLVQAVPKPLTSSTAGIHEQHLSGGTQQLLCSRTAVPWTSAWDRKPRGIPYPIERTGGISGGKIHGAKLGTWPKHLVNTLLLPRNHGSLWPPTGWLQPPGTVQRPLTSNSTLNNRREWQWNMVATKCPSPHPCAQLVSVTNNEEKYNLNKNGCTKQSGGWRGGGVEVAGHIFVMALERLPTLKKRLTFWIGV